MRVIIVGATEVARALAREFSTMGHDVIILSDLGPEQLAELEELDVQCLVGDPTHRRLLLAAGVAQADLFIAADASPTRNVVASALAKQMGAKKTLSSVEDPDFFATFAGVEHHVLGIDAVLNTARLAAAEIVRRIEQLAFRFVYNFSASALQVLLLPLRESKKLHNTPVDKLKLSHGAAIRAVIRQGILHPIEDVQALHIDDVAVLTTPPGALNGAIERLGYEWPWRRVVLVGGGATGIQLARRLSGPGRQIQIIEIDRDRASYLATELSDVSVLHADGTNPDLLRDIQVETADLIIASTRDDESNLTTALISQQLGVKHSYAIIRRAGYGEIYERIGIDGVVSRHEILTHALLDYSGLAIGQDAHTALPYSDLAIYDYTNTSKHVELKDIPMPTHGILLGHIRQTQALSIEPSTVLEPDDRLLFLGSPQGQTKHLQKLKKLS